MLILKEHEIRSDKNMVSYIYVCVCVCVYIFIHSMPPKKLLVCMHIYPPIC